MGNLLDANRENSEYINVVISNLTSPKKSDDSADAGTDASADASSDQAAKKSDDYAALLLAANKKDFEGLAHYLRGDYRAAFRPIRSAEGILAELFKKSSNKHLDDTRNLLEYCNVKIVRTNDHTAKYYLTMATRHLRQGEDLNSRGTNHSPYQYRRKLALFKGSIEASRRARKFAIAALIEYKTEDVDKKEYEKLTFDQFLANKAVIFPPEKINNYDAIKQKLAVYIENKEFPKVVKSPLRKQADSLNLMEIHDDNFRIITYERKSLLDGVLKEVSFEKDNKTDDAASTDSADKPSDAADTQ
ncbi:MAG: AraC family transcriptional regulator [Spirochaetota bacterium]